MKNDRGNFVTQLFCGFEDLFLSSFCFHQTSTHSCAHHFISFPCSVSNWMAPNTGNLTERKKQQWFVFFFILHFLSFRSNIGKPAWRENARFNKHLTNKWNRYSSVLITFFWFDIYTIFWLCFFFSLFRMSIKRLFGYECSLLCKYFNRLNDIVLFFGFSFWDIIYTAHVNVDILSVCVCRWADMMMINYMTYNNTFDSAFIKFISFLCSLFRSHS